MPNRLPLYPLIRVCTHSTTGVGFICIHGPLSNVVKSRLRARNLVKRINVGHKVEAEKRSYLPTLREVLRTLLEVKRKIRATTVRTMNEKRLVDLITLLQEQAEKLIHFKRDPDCGDDVNKALDHIHTCVRDITLKDTFRAAREVDLAIKTIADAIAMLEIAEWKLESATNEEL